jgi:adenylate cyclase class 2
MKDTMAMEIELKAWVENPEQLKKRLSNLGIYHCAYDKNDSYWLSRDKTGEIPPSGVRIRREIETFRDGTSCSRALVTYKVKEIDAGIEVNDEREFEISPNIRVFEDLLRRFGLSPGVCKRKQGFAWDCGGIRAELSDVEGLGWFIELEILRDDGDTDTIRESRERLLFLLDKLGLSPDRIESRPYTVMLRDLTLAKEPKNPHTFSHE